MASRSFLGPIRLVDIESADVAAFKKHLADCIVLTRENKILLQQRSVGWGNFAGYLTTFGGHVETGESVIQALVRELNEELGAKVLEGDVIFLGALSEDFTGHSELVHVHFWHDKEGTVTGVYECEGRYYDSVDEALSHDKIMDCVRWALNECRDRDLLK